MHGVSFLVNSFHRRHVEESEFFLIDPIITLIASFYHFPILILPISYLSHSKATQFG